MDETWRGLWEGIKERFLKLDVVNALVGGISVTGGGRLLED